ncbi:MAG TPA: ABC transporter substrate-binding protein [Steroidobacteraceae bacterium]|nr:ABC transporter substrate-binding protein [Steroidobacteraceae bacterium]
MLDWLLNANHASLFAAQHCGAFNRAGLEVTLVSPADPDSPSRLVAAGQADLAVSYGTQINMLVGQGLPLVRIATLVDHPLNAVAALDGGPIRSFSDLKGRTIGVAVGGVEEALLDAMLASAGIEPSDVTIVRANYGVVTGILSRRIDAAIGAFRNAEVFTIEAAGAKPLVFLPEDHGVPLYDELILVARDDRKQDPRFPRFLRAVREGTAALLKDPDTFLSAFLAAHPEQRNATIARAWPVTLAMLARDPVRLDRQRYLAMQDFCLRRGIIDRTLSLERFAVELAV